MNATDEYTTGWRTVDSGARRAAVRREREARRERDYGDVRARAALGTHVRKESVYFYNALSRFGQRGATCEEIASALEMGIERIHALVREHRAHVEEARIDRERGARRYRVKRQ